MNQQQYHGQHGPGNTHTYNHHGPIAYVTNGTRETMSSGTIIGILNTSQMARRSPDHAHLSIRILADGGFHVVRTQAQRQQQNGQQQYRQQQQYPQQQQTKQRQQVQQYPQQQQNRQRQQAQAYQGNQAQRPANRPVRQPQYDEQQDDGCCIVM